MAMHLNGDGSKLRNQRGITKALIAPINLFILQLVYNTSRTAQGGGGRFKKRKPIGEIGCCESRMAERVTDGPTGG